MLLPQAVKRAAASKSNFKFHYNLSLPIEKKISAIAKEIFRVEGAEGPKGVKGPGVQGFGIE